MLRDLALTLSAAHPSELWDSPDTQCPIWIPERRSWFLTTPQNVRTALRDVEGFRNAVPGDRDMNADFLLTVDGQKHSEERREFFRHFSVGLAETTAESERIVRKTWAEVQKNSAPDLLADFSRPLCKELLCRFMGCELPGARDEYSGTSDLEQRASTLLLSTSANASRPAQLLLSALVDDLGREPDLAFRQVHGLLCALLVAFEETLPAAVVITLLSAKSPEWSTYPYAHSHPLVLDTPLIGLHRVLGDDRRISNVLLARGEQAFVCLAAANRLSLQSGENQDYSFGLGLHSCPARGLVGQVLRQVLAYVPPQLRWVGSEANFVPHTHFRTLMDLPAHWENQ